MAINDDSPLRTPVEEMMAEEQGKGGRSASEGSSKAARQLGPAAVAEAGMMADDHRAGAEVVAGWATHGTAADSAEEGCAHT